MNVLWILASLWVGKPSGAGKDSGERATWGEDLRCQRYQEDVHSGWCTGKICVADLKS